MAKTKGVKANFSRDDLQEVAAAYREAAEHIEACVEEQETPQAKRVWTIISNRLQKKAERMEP